MSGADSSADNAQGRGELVEVDEVSNAERNGGDFLPAMAPEDTYTARGYAGASRAPGTQRLYESDWRRFAAWCRERGLASLPADPHVVAVFLAAEAALGPRFRWRGHPDVQHTQTVGPAVWLANT